ncbi:MAG: hypothetical protein IKT58_03580, partial [Oscillospiraceae bacterium]|nr:hypothetical protein [Oscillospiraceae bacterium]
MCKRLIVIFLLTALLLSVLSIGSVYALSQETVQTRGTGNGSVSASQEEIKELFARRSQGIHPRVLMHEEDFTALRHRVESDPYSKMLYARAYEYALDQLGEPLCIYELPDGQR